MKTNVEMTMQKTYQLSVTIHSSKLSTGISLKQVKNSNCNKKAQIT